MTPWLQKPSQLKAGISPGPEIRELWELSPQQILVTSAPEMSPSQPHPLLPLWWLRVPLPKWEMPRLAPTCVWFGLSGWRKPRARPCWSLSQGHSRCSRPLADDGAGWGGAAGPSLLPFLVEKDAESEAVKKSQTHPRRRRALSSHPHARDVQKRLRRDQQPNSGVKI